MEHTSDGETALQEACEEITTRLTGSPGPLRAVDLKLSREQLERLIAAGVLELPEDQMTEYGFERPAS